MINNFLSKLFLDVKRNYTKKKFPKFQGFKSIPRLSRDCVISEKLDGTNGIIYIDENNNIFAGSRNKWLWGSIQDEIHNDNYGFAYWVKKNKEELLKLGQGYHYGEWMGKGIQRGYGLDEKRFYLFNVNKWVKQGENKTLVEKQQWCPECCYVVPILYEGLFSTIAIEQTLDYLKLKGSQAIPEYFKPEGIVIFHKASGQMYKKTIENDEKGKTNVRK